VVTRVGGRPFYVQIAESLREDIRAGRYQPGDQLPSERELREQWKVSQQVVRAALSELHAEGSVVSYQGRGSFVRSQLVPRRLSTDISVSFGWYTSLAHQGFKPAGETRVTEEPCPADAAEWLGIEEGTTVTCRDRTMGVEGEAPAMLAASFFPAWVIQQVPDLAVPAKSGMPELLRAGFGETFSEDVLTVRMPTLAEQQRLELEKGNPVQVIQGATYDQQHRPLHFIRVVAAGGRIEFAYRYGSVPTEDS
jgi:DNA-binding GntR family transcriptional regulator